MAWSAAAAPAGSSGSRTAAVGISPRRCSTALITAGFGSAKSADDSGVSWWPSWRAALVALGAEHPKLELHVTELDPASVPDALRTGALDSALVQEYDYVPATPDPALETLPLLTETIFLASAEPGQGSLGIAARRRGSSAALARSAI